MSRGPWKKEEKKVIKNVEPIKAEVVKEKAIPVVEVEEKAVESSVEAPNVVVEDSGPPVKKYGPQEPPKY